MQIYSLDIETRPTDPFLAHCAALEPWRVRQGKAEISSIAVCRPDNSTYQIINSGQSKEKWIGEVKTLLEGLKGQVVYAHNTGFDLAFMICTIMPHKLMPIAECINNIRWRDTMLLTKWLINGQKVEDSKFSFSLLNLCKTFIPEHPMMPTFIKIKEQNVEPGAGDTYWEERGVLDVILTKALAEKLQPKLPESQRVGLMTEFACLVSVANSWVNGLKVHVDQIDDVERLLANRMNEALAQLHVAQTVINSPKQLANMLFNDWGLRPWSRGATGPSTAKGDLMWIQWAIETGTPPYSNDPTMVQKMGAVMECKKNATLISKYIKTLREALEHTGDGYIYGVPRIFGTYTGRMTYSNATYKGGPKVSIALHQMPRKAKEVRGLFGAPEGWGLMEDDASGQESRLMAIRSGDPVMSQVFRDNLNFHAMTGAAIIGMDYNDFMDEYKQEKDEGYYTEQRQLGKLTNLSCNYRIGGKALSEKALTNYETFIDEQKGNFLTKTFQRQYTGVPDYWKSVVQEARVQGYTEAFGGRRYKICNWNGRKEVWVSESSAINFPIQGGGASMKEIAIAELAKKFPEIFFCLDLHDATFNYAQLDNMKELEQDVLSSLNKIDYEAYWGFKPAIPLTYESASGLTFKDVK